MKQLVIIGAGGMGRTFYDMAKECLGYNVDFQIKGFIDDEQEQLDDYNNYPPVLGAITDYEIEENDVFICSIGGNARVKCSKQIEDMGGEFITLLHETARIGSNVRLGVGNFIGAYVSIGADAMVGNNNMIQSYTVIGHDAIVGNHVRIDTHVVCVGGVVIEDEVTIHTNSVISHNVIVGKGAKVGACSLVLRKVKCGTTVFGSPSKIIS